MDTDYAMDDVSYSGPKQYAQRISISEYEREAVEFTTQEVERLNAIVRAQPKLGARSEFFHNEENVARGLPVFQGKHTRFVYENEEITAAIDVTQEALKKGPVVRTVAELDEDVDEEEEELDDDEENYEQLARVKAVQNAPYKTERDLTMNDAPVDSALMQDVEMEMAFVAIHDRKLSSAAAGL